MTMAIIGTLLIGLGASMIMFGGAMVLDVIEFVRS